MPARHGKILPSTMPPRLYLSPPHLGEQELAFVREAFETNWIAPSR